jgi:hypothetical protein
LNGTQASSLRQPRQQTGVSDADQTIAATGAEPIASANHPAAPIPPADPPVTLSWKSYAMAIWLAGIGVLSAWLLRRLSGLRKEHLKTVVPAYPVIPAKAGIHRQPNPLPDQFLAQLRAAADRLGLKRLPQVVLTDRVSCPAVFGIFRPVLLMPAETFKHMSARETEHILLHELAHIKRGDLVVHGLYMTLQIAYWFNPLLWMIRRTLQNLRELCCDATVARLLREDTAGYRQTLLETARRLVAEPVDPGLGLLGLFENSNWLITRLHWLEKQTWKNRPLRIATIIALVSVMVTCVLPMANRPKLTAEDTEAAENHNFKTILDNGVTIELVGICNYPSEGQQWWTPDGSPCPLTIKTEDHSGYTSQDPGYEFVFRKTGDQPFKIESVKGSDVNSGLTVLQPADLTGKRVHIKSRYRKTDIKIASPSGFWKTVHTAIPHPKGTTSANVNGKTLVLAAIKEAANAATVSCSDELGFKEATRIIATDSAGNEYTGQILADAGVNNIRQRTIQFTVPITTSIAKISFQTCPYQYHTFKNVALRPDGKTDVEIQIGNPETDNQKAEEKNQNYNATLPNGVTVELLGLGTAPWKDEQQWWRPDGTNMIQPALNFPYPLFEWKDQPNGAQFTCAVLCKFSNHSNTDPSVPETKCSNGLIQGILTGLTEDGMQMTYLTWPPFLGSVPEKTDMRIAVGTGDFIRAERLGKYTPQQHQQYSLGSDSFAVILHPLRSGALETPCVDLTCKQKNKDTEFRVFAKLKNGKTERWSGGGVGGDVLFFQSTPKGRNNTKIEDIEDIIIEYRPYEWITFKNIALRPDSQTDVEVEIDEGHSAKDETTKAAIASDTIPGPQLSEETTEAVTPIPPPGRGALRFDGLDDFLQVHASQTLALEGAFTVQVWIKPEFPEVSIPDKARNLLCKGGFISSAHAEKEADRQADAYGFAVTLAPYDEDKMLVDAVTGDGGLYSIGGLVLPCSQEWTHLALKFHTHLYKPAPRSDLIIGSTYLIPFGHHYKGRIGELRIWNRELTYEEIQKYKTCAVTGSEPGLAACWTFEEDTGQRIPDISGNRNDARLGISYREDDSDPIWVPVDHESVQVTDCTF